MPDHSQSTNDFEQMCASLGDKMITAMSAYPKEIIVLVLPGMIAAVMRAFELPRDMIVAMIDSALEDIDA